MDKHLCIRAKVADIEIEVHGDCDEVKEQFAIAVETVKQLHQMKVESTSEATNEMTEKLMEPLLKLLK